MKKFIPMFEQFVNEAVSKMVNYQVIRNILVFKVVISRTTIRYSKEVVLLN